MSRIRLAPTPGALVVVALAVGYPLLWGLARPAGQPTARYIGEVLGAEAVFLLCVSLMLVTVLPAIERAFSGLDRVAVWHRDVSTVAVLLLIPHWVLATSSPDRYAHGVGPAFGQIALIGLLVVAVWALAPKLRAARWPGLVRRLARTTYERWLTAHRLAGIFVIVAVAHGGLVDPVVHASTLLRVAFFTTGGIGIAAYVYRELFARFVIPVYDYTVAGIRRPTDTTLEVSLEPVRAPISFRSGQFVFLELGGELGWERHPFSVASAPSAQRLQLAIKASGDYTRDLHDALQRGTPAKVVGPFGGFDYRAGGREQIWIAGGIGVTPFMSWIRDLNGSFDRKVDFYYSLAHAADAIYLDEVEAAAARHPSLRPHVVYSDKDGLLTPDQTLRGHTGKDVWVYTCAVPRR